MIATDEEALICDLAETYHIFDYRSLPARTVATLSVGLREDSRIKLKMTGQKQPMNTLLLASIADRLSAFIYGFSGEAKNGRNRPKSLVDMFLNGEREPEISVFDSPEAFERRRREIIEGAQNG